MRHPQDPMEGLFSIHAELGRCGEDIDVPSARASGPNPPPPTCLSSSPPSLRWSSTGRPPRPSASPSRNRCCCPSLSPMWYAHAHPPHILDRHAEGGRCDWVQVIGEAW